MKRLNIIALIFILAVGFISIQSAVAAEKKPIVWKMNVWNSANYHTYPMLDTTVNEIFKRSNGRLKIEIYPSFALGFDWTTWLRDHKAGLIDISYIGLLYVCGEEPSFCVLESEAIYDNVEQQVKAVKAISDFKRKVYDEVWNSEYIATGFEGTWSMGVMTKKKQIKTLGDLKGMKIRTAGPRGKELFEILGASPQAMGRGEVFMAMKTGVIDGFESGYGSLHAEGYHEVIDYATVMGMAPALENDIVVSKRVWDPLPDDLKQIVREEFKKWSEYFEQMLLEGKRDEEDKKLVEGAGVITNQLSQEDWDTVARTAKKNVGAWAERTGGRVAEVWEIVKPILQK